MTIELIDPNKIKITLTKADMQKINITYEELDYKDENTKEVLNVLLDLAKSELGFDSTGFRLFVEVFEDAGDECVFFFTRIEKSPSSKAASKIQVKRQSILPVILNFSNFDDIGKISILLSKNAKLRPISSDLYKYKDNYSLIIYIFHTNYKAISYLASEFTSEIFYGDVASSHIQEFGAKIIEDIAIERISSSMI